MKEFADDGGGPAGVVDGLEAGLPKPFAWLLALCCLEPGVDGELEETGTVQLDMIQ